MKSFFSQKRIALILLFFWVASLSHFIYLGIRTQSDCHDTKMLHHEACEEFIATSVALEKIQTGFFVVSGIILLFLVTYLYYRAKITFLVNYVSLLKRLFAQGILHSKAH